MTYEELQEEAKKLGIKYVGVGKKQLEKDIRQAKQDLEAETETEVKKDKDANTAIILTKNKQEIRRYTQEIHGDDFANLAKQFATDREYDVVYKQVKPGVPCPSCGHILYPDDIK